MNKTVFYGIAVIAVFALAWMTYSARKHTAELNGPVNTLDAPQPIGPYSQAVMRGNALFVSGTVGIDPTTGNPDTASITVETKRVMENIKAILLAAKMEMKDIAQVRIYLTDMGNFKTVNEIYGSYFGTGPFPARETVEVSELPKGMHIEISATAIR
jgi:2-iminobutanoate/2-iminopropanoate deaminase